MEYNFYDIGERIRQMRKKQFRNQDEFIDALGKQGVPIGRNTVSAIENGDQAKFTLPFLLACCSLFHCDIGYLLGEYSCKTRDIQFIHNETGLSEESISFLCHEKAWGLGQENAMVIDKLLYDCRYHNIDTLAKRRYRPILNLLDYFFKYSNSGIRKQVYSNGHIADRGQDNFISSQAIELNDVVIENAVLAEIQLALINLKKVFTKQATIDDAPYCDGHK